MMKMSRRTFFKFTRTVFLFLLFVYVSPLFAGKRPNIIFIFVDDMGYADPSCFGNSVVSTPNIDRLAAEGIRFTQFYINSPVCSPSRVAMTTGQYPGRWGIHSYLASRKRNKNRNMVDYLDAKAPSLARQLQAAGYATAHFGKWHMGGGRDVDDAPHPKAFGFDESSVAFEGLGNRVLFENHGLSDQNAKLKQGKIHRVPKYQVSKVRIDQTIDFVRRNARQRPVYINLWFNDVHDAHLPKARTHEKYQQVTQNPFEQKFYAVLVEMDRQIGRLMAALKESGQDKNTLIIFTSDNGPTDWPSYYKKGWNPPGSTGPFLGRKWSLYEGGIRMPFIVRWPDKVPAGKTNKKTVMCGVDLFPTLCMIANAPLPKEAGLDGQDMSEALLGNSIMRTKPILWHYPNQPKPGKAEHVSPMLAIRDGDWKLLMNPAGSDIQLYNLAKDIKEQNNLAGQQKDVAMRLSAALIDWYKTLKFRE